MPALIIPESKLGNLNHLLMKFFNLRTHRIPRTRIYSSKWQFLSGPLSATPSREKIIEAFNWFRSSMWIYENRSTLSQDKLLQIMEFGRRCHGIDVFIIDSLMKCGLGEKDYSAQKFFVEALCNFKNVHDCQIHLIAHPRKVSSEKQQPGKLDVKGSGTVCDLADNVFSVWRNKDKGHDD